MLAKMIQAGTDIFRLNCSHRRGGDFESLGDQMNPNIGVIYPILLENPY